MIFPGINFNFVNSIQLYNWTNYLTFFRDSSISHTTVYKMIFVKKEKKMFFSKYVF